MVPSQTAGRRGGVGLNHTTAPDTQYGGRRTLQACTASHLCLRRPLKPAPRVLPRGGPEPCEQERPPTSPASAADEYRWVSRARLLLSLDAATPRQHGLDVGPHRSLVLAVLWRRGRAGLAVL